MEFKGTIGKWHYDKFEQIIKCKQHLYTEYICEMMDSIEYNKDGLKPLVELIF